MKTILPLLFIATLAIADDVKITSKKELALSAIKELAGELKTHLQAAMKGGGTINALKVCNEKAMPITEKIQKEGIALGRVSVKNRNPNNLPKEWMVQYINAFHKGEIKTPNIEVDIEGGKKGLLMPIPTAGLCLTCHGEKLAPKVATHIKKLYPEDKATGFKAGDIRGFFWAEY